MRSYFFLQEFCHPGPTVESCHLIAQVKNLLHSHVFWDMSGGSSNSYQYVVCTICVCVCTNLYTVIHNLQNAMASRFALFCSAPSPHSASWGSASSARTGANLELKSQKKTRRLRSLTLHCSCSFKQQPYSNLGYTWQSCFLSKQKRSGFHSWKSICVYNSGILMTRYDKPTNHKSGTNIYQ